MKPKFLNSLFRPVPHRETISNTAHAADEREDLVNNAPTPPIDEGEDGWIKISPYGRFSGSRPGRPQFFGEAEANAMVGEFRGLKGRLGRLFRGIPVYIGHPDQNPEMWKDHRRLGKIVKLEARADGLWGEPAWNSLGRENKEEGYWMYPSPRWDAPAGRKEFRPDRLISVGLTNIPRITESEPVANSRTPNTEPDNTMDRKALADSLGMDAAATDEELLGKITSLKQTADTAAAKEKEANDAKAEAQTAKTEKETAANALAEATGRETALRSERDAAREDAVNARLDLATHQGKITKAEREVWEKRLAGENREAEANALAALTPKLNTRELDLSATREVIENANLEREKRREAISNAVDEVQRAHPGLSREDAWFRAKKDPKNKGLFGEDAEI